MDFTLRRLVVNADDLGLSVGVNDGIFDAHDIGIVTSASLFANAPATVDAIGRARERPSLGLGCHLALVDGAPVLPPSRVPTLVQHDRFRSSWRPFILDCLRGRISLLEVERELTAQIDRLASDGMRVTHLDAHKHVHAFPPVFAVVARLAARFRIPAVRVPFERPLSTVYYGRCVWRECILNGAMWPWARSDVRMARRLGLRTSRLVGRVHTGALDASTLNALLRRLPEGVTELMVHPGYPDAALMRLPTRLRSARADEVRLLCGAWVRDLLEHERIDLITHDLEPASPPSLATAGTVTRRSTERSGHAS